MSDSFHLIKPHVSLLRVGMRLPRYHQDTPFFEAWHAQERAYFILSNLKFYPLITQIKVHSVLLYAHARHILKGLVEVNQTWEANHITTPNLVAHRKKLISQ